MIIQITKWLHFSVILILGFVSIEESVGFERFGCQFKDKNYFPISSTKYPQYAQKPPQVIQFESHQSFLNFMQIVTNTYIELANGENFNVVDSFLQFYNKYVEYKADAKNLSNLQIFYEQYIYNFRPSENCVSLPIEFFDRFEAKEKNQFGARGKGYLASSRLCLLKEDLEKFENDGKDLLRRRKAHSVGIFKIDVEGTIGYIILDFGFSLSRPIVLFQSADKNESVKETQEWANTERYIYVFSFLKSNNKYAVGTIYDTQPRRELVGSSGAIQGHTTIDSYYIINVDQSFCSFMPHIDKKYLVSDRKCLIRRINGVLVAGFHVRIPYSEKFPRYFCLHYFFPNGTLEQKVIDFPLDPTQDVVQTDSREYDLLQLIDYRLDLPFGSTNKKLKAINSIMVNDKKFVKQMFALQAILYDFPQNVYAKGFQKFKQMYDYLKTLNCYK